MNEITRDDTSPSARFLEDIRKNPERYGQRIPLCHATDMSSSTPRAQEIHRIMLKLETLWVAQPACSIDDIITANLPWLGVEPVSDAEFERVIDTALVTAGVKVSGEWKS